MASLVWEPGQTTLVHDHWVWGLTDILHETEYSQPYAFDMEGCPHPSEARRRLEPGEVKALSPRIGDVHQVGGASSDRTFVSVHVYSADIGAVWRTILGTEDEERPFISDYSNDRLSNIWNLSKEGLA